MRRRDRHQSDQEFLADAVGVPAVLQGRHPALAQRPRLPGEVSHRDAAQVFLHSFGFVRDSQ